MESCFLFVFLLVFQVVHSMNILRCAKDLDPIINQINAWKNKCGINVATELEKEINEWTNKYEQYQLQIKQNTLIHDLEACKEENSKLNEKYKTIKLELNTLKNNYLEWEGDDIVYWIISLDDGEYKTYETQLKVAFNKENVNGKGIQFIDKIELKGWGIENFIHRQNLHQHIQNLVNGNNHKATACPEHQTSTKSSEDIAKFLQS
eukprot:245894_1